MKGIIAVGFAASNLYLDKKFQNPTNWRSTEKVVEESTAELLTEVPYFVDKINFNIDKNKIVQKVAQYSAEETSTLKFADKKLPFSIISSALAVLPVVIVAHHLGLVVHGSTLLNIAFGCYAFVSIFTNLLEKQLLESKIRGYSSASVRDDLFQRLPYGERDTPLVPPTVISNEETA